jgi:hypothetical protein
MPNERPPQTSSRELVSQLKQLQEKARQMGATEEQIKAASSGDLEGAGINLDNPDMIGGEPGREKRFNSPSNRAAMERSGVDPESMSHAALQARPPLPSYIAHDQAEQYYEQLEAEEEELSPGEILPPYQEPEAPVDYPASGAVEKGMLQEKYQTLESNFISNLIRKDYGLPEYENAKEGSFEIDIPDFGSLTLSPGGTGSIDPLHDPVQESLDNINGIVVDDSFGSSFMKGWEEKENWAGNLISAKFNAKGPEAMSEYSGNTFKYTSRAHPARYMMSDTLIDVLETLNGDKALFAKVQGMEEEERRQWLKKEKQSRFDQMHGTVFEDAVGIVAGSSSKAIFTDPLTLLPLGAGIKLGTKAGISIGMAEGGVMGGLDSGAESLAEKGEIDWVDVAVWTALGSAMGAIPGLTALGYKKFMGEARVALEKSEPLLLEDLRDKGIIPIYGDESPTGYTQHDLDKVNDILLGSSSNKVSIVMESRPGGIMGEPRTRSSGVMIGDDKFEFEPYTAPKDKLPATKKVTGKGVATTGRGVSVTSGKGVSVTTGRGVSVTSGKGLAPSTGKGIKIVNNPDGSVSIKLMDYTPPKKIADKNQYPAKKTTKKSTERGPVTITPLPNTVTSLPDESILDKGLVLANVESLKKAYNIGDVVDGDIYDKAARALALAVRDNDIYGQAAAQYILKSRPTLKVPLKGSLKGDKDWDMSGGYTPPSYVLEKGPTRPTTEFNLERDRDIQGKITRSENASQEVSDTLIDGKTGKPTETAATVLGKKLDDENVTAQEILETVDGAVTPTTYIDPETNLPTKIKAFLSLDLPDKASYIAQALSWKEFRNVAYTPSAVLQKFGRGGRALAERIARRRELLAITEGKFNKELGKILKDSGYNSMNKGAKEIFESNVKGILRGKVHPSQADKAANNVATHLKRHFNKVLKDALDSKVIDKKRFDELLASSKKDGYWPRVLNQSFLNTKRGRIEFESALTSAKLNAAQAKKVVDTLRGNGYKNIYELDKDKKTGMYVIRPSIAREIMALQKKKMNTVQSNHLQKDRTLDLPDSILDPFMVKGLDNTMAAYNRDAYGKIYTNRVMGDKGQRVALDLLRIKKDTQDTEAVEYALDTYFNTVGDIRGPAIKALSNQSHTWNKIQDGLSSFETLKLVNAQISNLTSALILTPTKIAATAPNFRSAVNAYAKALKASFSKEGWDMAEDWGAISDSLIIQMQSEMGTVEKRLNSRFLKGIGFTTSEQWNRVIASHAGDAIIRDLYTELDKMAVAAGRNGKSPKYLKKQKKIHTQLNELGLPLDRSKYTTEQLSKEYARASQRFSNTVNFVSASDKMPLTLQNPNVRLFRQFQTYSLFLGKYLKDTIVKPALRGDIAPLATFFLTTWVLGEKVHDARNIASAWTADLLTLDWGSGMAKDAIREASILAADRDNLDDIMAGFAAVGGLGTMSNVASAFSRGQPGEALLGLLGPAVGDVARLGTGFATAIAEQEPDRFYKAFLTTLPKGRHIKEAVYGNDPKTPSEIMRERHEAMQELLGR